MEFVTVIIISQMLCYISGKLLMAEHHHTIKLSSTIHTTTLRLDNQTQLHMKTSANYTQMFSSGTNGGINRKITQVNQEMATNMEVVVVNLNCVWKKKVSYAFALSLPNADQFSIFFHRKT